MTLFARASLDSPVLETSIERPAEVSVTLEQQTTSADGSLDLTMWASSDELDRFEDGLDADETVARWVSVGGTEGRKLYRTRLTDAASSTIDYHRWTDGKAVFLSAECEVGNWVVEGYFPDRSVLQDLAAGCESNDVGFDLLAVSDSDQLRDTQQFELSAVQAETLLTAHDRGYYSVPREVNLEELAEPFDVSHQAVSERLRRGVGSLIRNTVAEQREDGGTETETETETETRVTPREDATSKHLDAEEATLSRPVGVGMEAP